MYKVYRHYNKLTNKSYIGMTSLEPSKRWENGLSGYRNNQQMYNDIKNSDWNIDWVHEILCENASTREEAEYIESLFISWFDSINNGYNICDYGNHKPNGVEEKRKYLSVYTPHGRMASDETRKKMSLAQLGKTKSDETRIKQSRSLGVNGVIQCSKTGEFLNEFPSIAEAGRQTGCSSKKINDCLRGRRKSTGGFTWKYK